MRGPADVLERESRNGVDLEVTFPPNSVSALRSEDVDGVRSDRSAWAAADVPYVSHASWTEGFPWLVQGTTCRGGAESPFDLGLFSTPSPAPAVLARWERLRNGCGISSVTHARQVHGEAVYFHGTLPPGLHLSAPCDGHATASAGVLLTVTTADCVPVFLVDPARRAVALLHAGWRGVAAGILERGVDTLATRAGTRTSDLFVHLGPAICGTCYEVGPEVFSALGRPTPPGPEAIDLRAVLEERATGAGVLADRVSVSEHCTRCEGSAFFSHRGGDLGRQVAFLGIRG